MKKFLLSVISLFLLSQAFAGTLKVYYPAPAVGGKDCTAQFYRPVVYNNVEFLCATGNVAFFKIDGKRKAFSTVMLWEYTD